MNLFLLSDFSRNAPCPSKEPRPAKKRRIQKARPKRLPEISHEFLVNPPYRYVIMANGDPRISLGYEFMDAYVSGSAEIFTEMMNRKCDPNIVFMQHYDGRQNPYGPNERKIIGLRNVTDFWLTCMSSAPDIIPTIYETPTGFRNDITEESFVSVKTLNSMTKTGLVMDRQQLKALNAKEAIDVQGMINSLNAYYLIIVFSADTESKCEFKLVRLPSDTPIVTIHMCCKYSMLLNPEHKIVKMCQLFKVVQGDPQMSKY